MRAEEEPKARNRQTQAIKWSRDFSAPLSSSMAKLGDQAEKKVSVGKEGKQEGISQRSNEEKFEAGFPMDQARRLESHFRFCEAQGHFDLPTSCIRKDDLPSLLSIVNRLSGDEIPRFATITRARNHQK